MLLSSLKTLPAKTDMRTLFIHFSVSDAFGRSAPGNLFQEQNAFWIYPSAQENWPERTFNSIRVSYKLQACFYYVIRCLHLMTASLISLTCLYVYNENIFYQGELLTHLPLCQCKQDVLIVKWLCVNVIFSSSWSLIIKYFNYI